MSIPDLGDLSVPPDLSFGDQELAELLFEEEDDLNFQPNLVLLDWGRSSTNWQGFLKDFQSAARYEKVVTEFLLFHELQDNQGEEDLIPNMTTYFQQLYDAGFAATSLRSRFSALKKFWLHTGRGDLNKLATLVDANLVKWAKSHTIKQSKVFSKENYVALYNLPRTADSIIWIAYAAVATAIAARHPEIHELTWNDVKRVTGEDGVPAYHIHFNRSKQSTSNSTDGNTAILQCALGVLAVDDYISLFPKKNAHDNLSTKFWRKFNSKNGISVTWRAQNVGKDTCKMYGKAVAEAIGLPDPQKYTGHCWRRSAATLAANAGLSLAQIKAMTGHRSDTVVQKYIETSLPMKLAAAVATATFVPSPKPPLSESEPSSAGKKRNFSACTGNQENVVPNYNIVLNITGDVSAPLSLFNRA